MDRTLPPWVQAARRLYMKRTENATSLLRPFFTFWKFGTICMALIVPAVCLGQIGVKEFPNRPDPYRYDPALVIVLLTNLVMAFSTPTKNDWAVMMSILVVLLTLLPLRVTWIDADIGANSVDLEQGGAYTMKDSMRTFLIIMTVVGCLVFLGGMITFFTGDGKDLLNRAKNRLGPMSNRFGRMRNRILRQPRYASLQQQASESLEGGPAVAGAANTNVPPRGRGTYEQPSGLPGTYQLGRGPNHQLRA